MTRLPFLVIALCLSLPPAAGFAQAPSQVDCAALATQQTGYDPNRPSPPPATASPQVAGTGSRARGAAAGAMIGSASGQAGTGAAAGAVAGGVAQRSRSRRSARQHNDAVAQQQQAGQTAYNQALSACMSGHNQAP